MNSQTKKAAPTQEESAALDRLREQLVAEAAKHELVDISYRIVDSPIGRLLLAGTEAGLVRVAFETEGHEHILEVLAEKISPRILKNPRNFDRVAYQLEQYFDGTLHDFDLPLDLQLSTAFRRQVQLELGNIGYGQTRSYLQVAEHIGKPKAVRAVGSACATNPLPIVLPCHRVLRSDGSLGGYLGGLDVKTTLLRLENPSFAGSEQRLF
ncbi:methylated-DNA--protein-cysteine methyltransferase [Glutamicibacter uratoxydans]|uniref:Methylated-DNA--protein-cysteine methyltransferase n=1 Tax=Glutamicibacter uratoxydans TaxID=43667 RepID=A0A4Y4DS65_GLUUR|nr:methylated-DNA--[protein]-cysteine S-methyltransferase [Glutamicibacter uratoxydans]GED07477.1 methylated-DNA--protein-cysteine methyltransferase [Glutamicibacter uratoxydans]